MLIAQAQQHATENKKELVGSKTHLVRIARSSSPTSVRDLRIVRNELMDEISGWVGVTPSNVTRTWHSVVLNNSKARTTEIFTSIPKETLRL